MRSSCITLDGFHSHFKESEAATADGPVYITADGDARFVLLSYEDYAAMVRLARLPSLRMDQLMVSFVDDEALGISAGPTVL